MYFQFSSMKRQCLLLVLVDLKLQLQQLLVHLPWLLLVMDLKLLGVNRVVTRARAAALTGTTSDSGAPPSDSATVAGPGGPGTEDVIEIEDDVCVGSKRKLKSTVLLEFDRVQLNGVWKAQCQWCKKLLGGETRNGTKHLKNHLEICESRSCRKGL